ncbi:uncharacterized protein LOC122967458 [Thunnus albacares]|uniref:uncharacterized protein LOC122967458 n=1 Tax=Thunnus albacares TaxID=8236 RepID=UPI001CF6B419|nr:uncharacterized protein LOC122967458 [Thunnus albacares]XP_044188067.1 uncharacterized protein LOC122967458 [Thunnus albacares]XP_044188068.1 uncharacterized protein LOC122967458 [Thunnus albacares]
MDIRDSLLFLLVFLSLINLSKEACDDYFTFNYWKNNFTIGMINLATTNNSKDVVECTLDTYCKNKPDTCFLLLDCFKDMNQTEKCSPQLGKSENVTIHTYHFMCMVYKKANVSLSAEVSEFCSITNYETVCQFVAETTKSEKQAQNSVAVDKACPDNLILRLLPISIGFAMALLLLVYIYMRKQRRLNIRRATHVSNETMPGAETIIELQADTPHANGIVERTRLMQPEEYPSAVAPSADADAEADVECSVESGTQL